MNYFIAFSSLIVYISNLKEEGPSISAFDQGHTCERILAHVPFSHPREEVCRHTI